MVKILIVEDNTTLNTLLVRSLSNSYEVKSVFSVGEAINCLKENQIDIVVSDVKLPDMSGLELLETIKSDFQTPYIIFITGYGTVEEAVSAIKRGASDYILKPVEVETLRAKIDILAENINLKKMMSSAENEIVYCSKQMGEVLELAKRVAKIDSTIMITGETGVGKGLIAKFIHNNSLRKNRKFFEINCANFIENIFESELFGYKKGAFTGATSNKTGIVKVCDGGTLFLDEIAEIPLNFQAKLLKFIEEKRYLPVGAVEYEKTDVRLLVATNRSLESMVKDDKFRKDLFFRLNVVSIHIPPLRERRDDIPCLVEYFIKRYKHINPDIDGLEPSAMDYLLNYSFPGNVRELSNIIERGMILEKEDKLRLKTICGSCLDEYEEKFNLEEVIKDKILKALEICKGDKSQAASLLCIDRSTLYRKLKEYNILL